MIEAIRPYLDGILAEKGSAWAFLGILYILAGFFVRSWFLGVVTGRARVLEKSHYRKVKSEYFKRSLFGWLFFFLPVGLFSLFWQQALPVKINELWIAAAALASFILSIIFHLQAFGLGAVEALKEISDSLKEKNLLEG